MAALRCGLRAVALGLAFALAERGAAEVPLDAFQVITMQASGYPQLFARHCMFQASATPAGLGQEVSAPAAADLGAARRARAALATLAAGGEAVIAVKPYAVHEKQHIMLSFAAKATLAGFIGYGPLLKRGGVSCEKPPVTGD